MKKTYLLIVLSLLFIPAVFAQLKTITGKVTDLSGKPIESATIKIKGTRRTIAADDKGNFKINARIGDVLIISSINSHPVEIKISEQTEINVVLEKAVVQLDEVFVTTALGIKRSKNTLPLL